MAVRVNAFGALFQRLVERRQRRQRAPGHRKRREIEMAYRLVVADHKRHGLAAKAHEALREHGLVGEMRNHPVAIGAGHILGGEDGDDSRIKASERLDVAQNERGVRVRRAHRARHERFRRPFVRAEDFRSGELADAVETGDADAQLRPPQAVPRYRWRRRGARP